jgi:multicomponent Na+:H+ antiporter subunit G
MIDLVTSGLMLIGATFYALAALGTVRMPDLFTRMQPATKAATLGISCMMLALACYFGRTGVTLRAVATIAFVFVTAPVTAHLIARSAYFVGVPLWQGTLFDELRGHYNPLTHDLETLPWIPVDDVPEGTERPPPPASDG